MTNKERQDIELCAQKATLQQQRSHIEILESALNRAQMHINQVEEQVIEHQFKLIPSQSDSFFLGGDVATLQYRRQCGEKVFHPAVESSRYLSSSNVQNAESAVQSSQREMANMEIRFG